MKQTETKGNKLKRKETKLKLKHLYLHSITSLPSTPLIRLAPTMLEFSTPFCLRMG
jgi:hypothetical protein